MQSSRKLETSKMTKNVSLSDDSDSDDNKVYEEQPTPVLAEEYIRWTNRFEPKKLSDMCINTKSLEELVKWLKEFYTADSETTFIIRGDHGTGKTLGVNLAANQAGFEPKTIKLANISAKLTEKELLVQLTSMLDSGNVNDMLEKKKSYLPLILFDNSDGMTAKNEREMVKRIHKVNMKYRRYPIVVVATNRHSKLLPKIDSECRVAKLDEPDYEQMLKLTQSIIEATGMKLEARAISTIIGAAQKDLRRLINMLEEAHRLYRPLERPLDFDTARRFVTVFREKDRNSGLFDSAKTLFYRYSGVEEACNLFNSDKVLLPLMVHENFYQAIAMRKARFDLTDDDCLDAMADIAESISLGDNIENNIYGDQIWSMMNVYGFYSCAKPSYIINSRWPSPADRLSMVYPKDLNKTYLRKINHAHIEKVDPIFGDKTIPNYLLSANIVNKLIAEEDIDGLREMFADYPGINSRTIEALLKIDKIKLKVGKAGPKIKRDRQRKILKLAFGV